MIEDISYYYNILSDNILIVEEDKTNKVALDKVMFSFNKIFEYIKLFLIEKKERYYGYILINLRLELTFTKEIIAAVNLDTNPFTMIINPLLLGKYSIKEIIYIICHEIEHLVLNHPAESVRLNQTNDDHVQLLLNLAMDASVNDRLDMEIEKFGLKFLSTPKDSVTSVSLGKRSFTKYKKLESFIYYFNKLNDSSKKLDDDDCGVFYRGKTVTIINCNDSSNEIVTMKDLENKKIIVLWSEDDSCENLKELIKEFVKRVLDGFPGDFRGLLPSHEQEAIDKLMSSSKIKWTSILRRYVGMVPNSYKKTKMRINRRQPLRYDIPGRIDNRIIKLIVAIDTSASMSKEHLSYIFVEIFSILKSYKYELTVIECDSEIQNVYTAKNMNEINLTVSGRGGTAFTPVIDYINSNKKYYGSVLIYFTDGFGESEIPKPRTYRNLWVLVDSDFFSLIHPFGDVVDIEM